VPGRQPARQVLATNIDYALVVQGLDDNFNPNRLERYLVQLAACNIPAVVILNKADLVMDPEYYRNAVHRLKRDCPVYVCSTFTGSGIAELQASLLQRFRTYILIGSSGVGKSSMLNAFLNAQAQKTSETSDFNGKGRHTTSTRDLFLLPNGSLIIDTPGMREFGLTAEEGQSSGDTFPGLQQFVSECRFADCSHMSESGCAVLQAVQSGALDQKIYNGYVKLMKEQRRFEIGAEEKKRLSKHWGKITREAINHRKKYKY
jgi:ribosome biogenesis GTPase